MAGVDLTGGLWLNLADNPADFIVLPLWWGSGASWPITGESRPYANGALRSVTAGKVRDSWKPKLGVVTSAVALDMKRRTGLVHYARDPIGQRIPCVWYDCEPTWGGPGRGASVTATLSLTLQRTGYTDTV